MTDNDTPIEAYGVNDVIGIEARDGLVIIQAVMRGGETVHFAMMPRISAKIRPMLRDAERAANAQRAVIQAGQVTITPER